MLNFCNFRVSCTFWDKLNTVINMVADNQQYVSINNFIEKDIYYSKWSNSCKYMWLIDLNPPRKCLFHLVTERHKPKEYFKIWLFCYSIRIQKALLVYYHHHCNIILTCGYHLISIYHLHSRCEQSNIFRSFVSWTPTRALPWLPAKLTAPPEPHIYCRTILLFLI